HMWHVVNHTSTIAYGTWSFDVYINTTKFMSLGEHLYIFFMGDSLEVDQQDCYDIMIWISSDGTPGFTLWKRVNGKVTELGSYSYPSGLSGWYHIDVTRHTSGQFFLFVNGSLRIDAMDKTHTTSKYFGFVALDGHKLDNINVFDEINVFPKPSNLKFSDDSVTVSCQQNSSNTACIYVQNEGEIAGSATIEVGETPDGISLSLSDTSISTLKFGKTKTVTATVETSGTVTPGDYTVDVELYNDSNKLDTVQLAITVTGKETTSTTTDNGTAPGIPILGVVMILGIITAFRRKQR
ncbi:MAG: hypothetical protein ACFFDI_26820, partial [Promethearchaeota archaeon]